MEEISFGSLRELRAWLVKRGIPVHLWGRDGMKRDEDLWLELRTGESVLVDHPPERRVSCVSLVIRRGGKQLIEVRQELANKETRRRFQPPAEKMLPDEEVAEAAFRCVKEELGISRESCRIVSDTAPPKVNKGRPSPSYPGLRTRYVVHEVEMAVPGLPETAFSTPESAGSGDTAVVMHHWEWCGWWQRLTRRWRR
jgi:hypothetical protein